MLRLAPYLWVIALLSFGHMAQAQTAPSMGKAVSPVVVVNTFELFQKTKLGQQILADIEARRVALQRENERITQALIAEEQELTLRRETLAPEVFRAEAAEFDARVQAIRRARDTAQATIEQTRAEAPQKFLAQVRPILWDMMLERDATVMLNEQVVLLARDSANITQAAIAMIDARFPSPSPADSTE